MKGLEGYRDEFVIEEVGYLYILKLIEKRVTIDIENDENKIKEIKKDYYKINDKEILSKIKKEMKLKSYKKMEEIKNMKEAWLRQWKNEVYVGRIEEIKEVKSIKIRNMYWEKCKDEKMFLILQEVLLSPIYYRINKFEFYNLKENTLKKSAEVLSRYLNVEEETGLNILNKTKKMLKEGNRLLKKRGKINLIKSEQGLKNMLIETGINKMGNENLLLFMVKSLNYINYLKSVEEMDKVQVLKDKFWELKKDYEKEALSEKIEWNKERQEIINFIYDKMIEI